MTKRCVIYCRVSSDQQAKTGDSLREQLETCRKYAADNDMKIVREYIDGGESGQKATRTEYKNLMHDLDNFDVILFTRLDRWGRNLRNYLNAQSLLDDHNVTWISVSQPQYRTDTASGRMTVSVLMSVAQYEAEIDGERIKAVLADKKARGEVVSGSVPYGTMIKEKRLVASNQAGNIKTMYDTFLKTGSVHQAYRKAMQLGITRSERTVTRMLRNRNYVVAGVISKDDFEDAQRFLKMNVRCASKHDYIFSGLVQCPGCGWHLHGTQMQGRYYYRCKNPDCDFQGSVAEKRLESQILEIIKPELEKYIVEYEIKESGAKDIEKKKKQLSDKIERIKDLYVDGMISRDDMLARIGTLQKQIDDLPEKQDKRDIEKLKIFFSLPFEEQYKTFTNIEKRRLWRSIIKTIHVHGRHKLHTYTIDFLG